MFIDSMEFNNSFSPLGIQNFYVGKVLNNEDPKKLGRVKVSIVEIFGEQPVEKLPWCSPFLNSPSEFNCPEVGDLIVVYFPYGIAYFPFFFGHWHLTTNHDSLFDADYPNTVGFNRGGFSITYNKVKKEYTISHPEGTTVSIGGDGTISFNTNKNLNINAKEGVNISSDGNISISGKSGISFSSDGEAEFKGKGGTKLGDSSSQTMVNGSLVLLAGGGVGVCVVGSQGVGTGNLGGPVLVTMISGSSKVMAPM